MNRNFTGAMFLRAARLVACVALVAAFGNASFAQSPTPTPATVTEAAANIVPLRDANNNPISNVQALVSVVDNGSTLDITGLATGMDPAQQYVSLFYDTNSLTTGLGACLPTPGGPQQTFSQMVIGIWLPLGSSTRTLKASKFGPASAPVPLAYLAVKQIGTVSVRLDSQPTVPVPNAPDPARFQIQSCGRLVVTRTTPVPPGGD